MNIFIKTFTVIFLLLPASVFATTAVVEINTDDQNINALEGTLILPESANVREIQTGNSVILIWIEKPHQIENIISFAGITPGGFSGIYPVFTIHGVFTKEDIEQIRFESVLALKNDGTGKNTPVNMSLSLVAFKADAELPEEFTPTIATDPNIFDGKHFLVFATQDKSSGIDRYEVREGRWGWFKEAESPHLLKYQRLDRDVYVKAIDNTGNERMVIVSARAYGAWLESYGLFAILIMIVFVALTYNIKRYGYDL